MDQVPKPHPLPGVQPGGWLVQDQQLRITQHGGGDAHPLKHAAGELAQLPPGVVGQAHGVQEFLDPPVRLFPRNPLERRRIAEELPGGIAGVIAELLGQVAKDAPVGLPQCEDVLPVPQNLSPGREEKCGEHLDEGGLPRAVGGQEAVDTRREGKGDVLQGGEIAVLLGDVFNGQHSEVLLLSGESDYASVP